MKPEEFSELARSIQKLPKPTIDRVLVRSRQEIDALYEWMDKKTISGFSLQALVGIPVVIDDETPEGVLRFMLEDEIIKETPVR